MSPVIPQERPLIDRLREAVPELEWRMSGKIATGRDAGRDVVSANQRGHLLCWVNAKDEPHAVDIQYPGDTEAVRIVREWWEKTHPQADHARREIDARTERMDRLIERLHHQCPSAYPMRTAEQGVVVMAKGKRFDFEQTSLGWRSNDRPTLSDGEVADVIATHIKHSVPQPARDPIAERGERLKALLPMLTWGPGTDAGNSLWLARDMHTEVVTIGSDWVTAFTRRQGRKHPDAIDQARYSTDDELIALLTKWRDATYPQQQSRTEALVEAIRAACPEVNVYSNDGAVRVFWDRMIWRFVPDGENWRSGDTHCTQRGAVHEIRRYIDTHTLAEDQSLEGLFGGDVGSKSVRKKQEKLGTRAITEARAVEYAENGHTPESIITGAPTMDTKTLTQTIKVDASEAAWRTAGSQFVKLAREPLVGLLTRHLAPGDDAFRARLAAFLETELGTALLASMLSASLSALPQTAGDVPQKLARELRVKAMADAGDVLADVLMGPLRQVIALYLQDPQGAPQLGVAQATAVDFARAEQKEGVR